MTYQEKNHWIAIVITLWAICFYFLKVSGLEGGLNSDIEGILPTIVKIIVYSSVAAVVLAIVNWALNKEKYVEKDEMDRQIELKGYRNAYWVCSGSLWVVIVSVLLNEYAIRQGEGWYQMETINLTIHGIFLVAWVSTLVQSVTHVVFYRRGVA